MKKDDFVFWVKALVVDAIAFYLLYLWLIEGVTGAKNVVVVCITLLTIWYFVLYKFLRYYHSKPEKANEDLGITAGPYPYGFNTYSAATDFAFFSALVWFGHFLFAAVFLIGWGAKTYVKQTCTEEAIQERKEEIV